MNILSIETSSNIQNSIAIHTETTAYELGFSDPMNLNIRLFPAIRWLLEQSEITIENINVIVVSAGPGSFTGLRIGATAAKTLSYFLDIPLFSISTLYVIADSCQSLSPSGLIVPLIKARQNMVYTSVFKAKRQGIVELTGGCQLVNIEQLCLLLKLYNSAKDILLAMDSAITNFPIKVLEKNLKQTIKLAPPELSIPKASKIAKLYRQGKCQQEEPLKFKPLYVLPSQAEEKLKIFVT